MVLQETAVIITMMLEYIVQEIDIFLDGLPVQIPINSPTDPEVILQIPIYSTQLMRKSFLGKFPESRGLFYQVKLVYIQFYASFVKFTKEQG